MSISVYSFLMAVLWFSVFILLSTVLQRKTGFILCYRLAPLVLLLALTCFRIMVPIELPFTRVVQSRAVFPGVEGFLFAPWLQWDGVVVTGSQALLGVWAAVALFLSIRLCLRIHRDSRLLKSLPCLPCQDARRCLKRLLPRRGSKRAVGLCVSPHIQTPMLVGLVKPGILLPQEAANLSDLELEYILRHELTHLSHKDLWAKFLVRLLCCLMWWNPLAYLLQKDLDSLLEYRCDLAVTKGMRDEDKMQYLETVMRILRELEQKREPRYQNGMLQICFSAIPEAVVLKQRFHLVFGQGHTGKRISKIALAIIPFALLLCSYSVVVQPAYEPPASDVQNEIKVTPENSYILADSDGTYYLVYKGERFMELTPELLKDRPNCFLPIQNEMS